MKISTEVAETIILGCVNSPRGQKAGLCNLRKTFLESFVDWIFDS